MLALALAGCIVIKESPAPGCVKYLGPAPMGGCFGKAVIGDLRVEPGEPCLRIRVNNCNGGIVTVENGCRENLTLGDYVIEPSKLGQSFELMRGADGIVQVNRSAGNFGRYRPEADDNLSKEGALGGRKLTVSYTKTGPLC